MPEQWIITGTSICFVNGVSVGTDGDNEPPGSVTHELRIGSWSGAQSTSDYFQGLIDDVTIYDRALSAEEIEQLYQVTGDIYYDRIVNFIDFATQAGNWRYRAD